MKFKNGRDWFYLSAVFIACAFNFIARADTNLYLATPGGSWSLEIDYPGLILEERTYLDHGVSARLMARDRKSGMILTAFLEKAPAAGGANEARDYYWKRTQKSPMKKEDIKASEIGAVALEEYTAKDTYDTTISQKNLNAYLAKDGYWADVHISTTHFKPEDEPMLLEIVKSIRFNDGFNPGALVWAGWGSYFMAQRNYAEAARCNEKAMEAEKTKPALGRRGQVFLLNDLINCYGNLGNHQKAREMSELGLQKEPGYPQFYYSLACSYAELGDKIRALDNLKKAFQNQAKLFPGDALGNPRKDSSFLKYVDDPDFMVFYQGLHR